MRVFEQLRVGFFAAAICAAGCNGSSNNTDSGSNPTDDASTQTDAMMLNPSAGTCDSPIDLMTAGMRNGDTITYSASTEGAMNVLHPNQGCAMTDSAERVFHYHFEDNVVAIRVSTEGSAYDTVLYARTECSQPANIMDVMDLACNNDSYDHAPQSIMYLMHPMEDGASGDVFIVVDGSPDAMMGDNGMFTLTVTEVALGSQGNPCRPPSDGTGPISSDRCDGNLRCSEGGSPDGTAICVSTVANGAMCDSRGFSNTCLEGSTCASDPTPPDGMEPAPVCALPGTRAGAPCRMDDPRCDGALECGSGDTPVCVRALAEGAACDPMGFSNVCGTGLHCQMVGDAGEATCVR